jgi:hypothetical protein
VDRVEDDAKGMSAAGETFWSSQGPKGASPRDCPEADTRCFHRDDLRRGRGMKRDAGRFLVAALLVVMPASAQSIFKCKGPDGRTTYSTAACAGEGAALPITAQGRAAAVTANSAGTAAALPAGGATAPADEASPPVIRAPLPKQCDNGASLQFVVARLDSATTPDDIRSFLADERFRLLRCEFTRFSAEERRERDAAIRDLEARDAVRRRAAILRVETLYDRYLSPSERTTRARQR